jgi:methylmalonyl-CoA/ethylmalonyl-CoA epimerase
VRLHHIGKVVEDINESVRYYMNTFGLKSMGEAVIDPVQKVEVVFIEMGSGNDVTVELIRPVSKDSPVTEFLKQGGGLHHLCFEVEDIHKSIEEFKKKDALVLGIPVPGKGHQDRLTVWLYTSKKELVELVENASENI